MDGKKKEQIKRLVKLGDALVEKAKVNSISYVQP
jgi:hypothetical protein